MRRETPATPDQPASADDEGRVGDRDREVLEDGARSVLGRPLDQRELALFEKYLSLLRKWQRVQRLVGSPDPRWIIEHLLLDSLLFLQVIPNEASRVADLGSGAGFPGIPIKIVKPAIELTLIESKQRRVSFLATVVRDLALSGTGVLSSRAEAVDDQWRGVFDVVVARCAGQIARILPAASRLARQGGVVILADSPSRRPLEQCERVEVSGLRPGTTRAFAILRNASPPGARH